jgi:hypothetical protein
MEVLGSKLDRIWRHWEGWWVDDSDKIRHMTQGSALVLVYRDLYLH